MTNKRSKHVLKRIIEDAVSTVCGLPQPGLSFLVDDVESHGRPPALLRVWYTLHFFEHGSPFCCDGAGCHLWLFAERLNEIGNCVRLSMSLRQPVKVTFVGASVNVHAGVTFLDGKRCCEALGCSWRGKLGWLTDDPMQRTVLQSDDRSDDPRRRVPRRMEVFTGAPGRRRWPDELKALIVLESLAPDAVVTQVAQRHGCRLQQIHDWRRLARAGALALPGPVG